MPIAVQFDKIGKDVAHVIQRVRPFGVTRNFGDLPRGQVTVNVFGQLLTFFGELVDFVRDIYCRFGLHVAQFFNLSFKLRNRLFKIEEGLFSHVLSFLC